MRYPCKVTAKHGQKALSTICRRVDRQQLRLSIITNPSPPVSIEHECLQTLEYAALRAAWLRSLAERPSAGRHEIKPMHVSPELLRGDRPRFEVCTSRLFKSPRISNPSNVRPRGNLFDFPEKTMRMQKPAHSHDPSVPIVPHGGSRKRVIHVV